jgi:hypothetical protein
LQVAPSEFLFSRGKRRAACPLARGCVLRVNGLTVGRTKERWPPMAATIAPAKGFLGGFHLSYVSFLVIVEGEQPFGLSNVEKIWQRQ